jgi:hypothetical protein
MAAARKPEHHHGYVWVGSGFELARDGIRRPQHPEFRSIAIVPLELADWLLKAKSLVRGTFREPEAAAHWFGGRISEHAEAFATEHDRRPEAVAARVGAAAAAVGAGRDVAGGWYLTGQRFASVCLIACDPHPFRPQYRCPCGPAR